MVSARPLAAPSGFARTLLRLCFAKLLASLVGGPDGFAAGASRAQATRRLPARANDARPRTLRTSRCLAATCGSVAATWLEAMPRQSRHHRRPLRVRRPQDTNAGLRPTRNDTKKSFLWLQLIDATDFVCREIRPRKSHQFAGSLHKSLGAPKMRAG